VTEGALRGAAPTSAAPTGAEPTSEELRAAYARDGYCVARALLPAEALARAAAEVWAALPALSAQGALPAGHPHRLPPGARGALLSAHAPHAVSPAAAALLESAPLTALRDALLGEGARWAQAMLFFKPPGAPGQAWHQDERFLPTPDRSLLGVWVAIDAAGEENGGLWVAPGSHEGPLLPSRPCADADEFDGTPECFGEALDARLRARPPLLPPLAPGDALCFHGALLHRSLRNRAARPRRALVLHAVSAAAPLPAQGGLGPYARFSALAPPPAPLTRGAVSETETTSGEGDDP